MRYLIKFSKDSSIKFISHLDIMRTIGRMVRRAELPAEYSKGFNPHLSLSIAQPLSVGVYSSGEYMDLVLVETLECDELIDRLNEAAPMGIRFLDALAIEEIPNVKKVPQAMAAVEAASYKIKLRYDDVEFLGKEVKEILKKQQWEILKESKKGDKMVDIRPMVLSFDYEIDNNILYIDALLSCGSKANLSPDLLAKYLKANTTNVKTDAFVDIERIDMLAYKNKKLVPLIEALSK
ncbi:TIGR03936 family radical SAM-associated protein [Clostridium cellulovorans]|uniref:DUF2344 domain-containing protein n=1 Tax=Clostridium cellulovorans (strain ATCC 35296 / DSM 3052 / OCM 3 / 743B) TaxID=573061 RepID=D9SS04_CLOC7|nr:TIGR03936 family radical SAM-associated protein [Clostridium cellulovorans]ADL52451.1 Protein of unknown function DUF2344 [Clostridium cellulovorans 743B]